MLAYVEKQPVEINLLLLGKPMTIAKSWQNLFHSVRPSPGKLQSDHRILQSLRNFRAYAGFNRER